MFHHQNMLNLTTFSPMFFKLFKSIGITNLKRFEIFDRGRECDLNMKPDENVMFWTLTLGSPICAKLFRISMHILRGSEWTKRIWHRMRS